MRKTTLDEIINEQVTTRPGRAPWLSSFQTRWLDRPVRKVDEASEVLLELSESMKVLRVELTKQRQRTTFLQMALVVQDTECRRIGDTLRKATQLPQCERALADMLEETDKGPLASPASEVEITWLKSQISKLEEHLVVSQRELRNEKFQTYTLKRALATLSAKAAPGFFFVSLSSAILCVSAISVIYGLVTLQPTPAILGAAGMLGSTGWWGSSYFWLKKVAQDEAGRQPLDRR